MDFGDERPTAFKAAAAAETDGGILEIRIGDLNGARVGTCLVPETGGLQTRKTVSCMVDRVVGVHDLYFVFKGGSGMRVNFDWLEFQE